MVETVINHPSRYPFGAGLGIATARERRAKEEEQRLNNFLTMAKAAVMQEEAKKQRMANEVYKEFGRREAMANIMQTEANTSLLTTQASEMPLRRGLDERTLQETIARRQAEFQMREKQLKQQYAALAQQSKQNEIAEKNANTSAALARVQERRVALDEAMQSVDQQLKQSQIDHYLGMAAQAHAQAKIANEYGGLQAGAEAARNSAEAQLRSAEAAAIMRGIGARGSSGNLPTPSISDVEATDQDIAAATLLMETSGLFGSFTYKDEGGRKSLVEVEGMELPDFMAMRLDLAREAKQRHVKSYEMDMNTKVTYSDIVRGILQEWVEAGVITKSAPPGGMTSAIRGELIQYNPNVRSMTTRDVAASLGVPEMLIQAGLAPSQQLMAALYAETDLTRRRIIYTLWRSLYPTDSLPSDLAAEFEMTR